MDWLFVTLPHLLWTKSNIQSQCAVHCTMQGISLSLIQWNLSNLACTGRDILCQKSQGVELHIDKHIENGQKGMKINIRLPRKMNYIGVGLKSFTVTWSSIEKVSKELQPKSKNEECKNSPTLRTFAALWQENQTKMYYTGLFSSFYTFTLFHDIFKLPKHDCVSVKKHLKKIWLSKKWQQMGGNKTRMSICIQHITGCCWRSQL